MDLLAALALLALVAASATIVALEAVLGRTPAPVRLPARALPPRAHAHARGRAAHPAGHARRSLG